MRYRTTVVLFPLMALALATCHGAPPNSAVPSHLAERYYGTRAATTPIAAIVHDNDIRAPDPASPRPLLEQLQAELAKSDPRGRYRGITYDLTKGNALDRDWIAQSPPVWGRKADELPFFPLKCKEGASCAEDVALPVCTSDADCGGGTCGTIWPAAGSRERRRVCLGHSDFLVDRLQGLIASARRSVDIALLQPAPDARFLAALRAGLAELGQRGRPIQVRVMVGQYPPEDTDAEAVLKSLGVVPPLAVHVAAMRSCTIGEPCDGFSWNHAKIVAIDGRAVMAGGHNLWSADYLTENPVADLSIALRGPAATSATRFLDELWGFACLNAGKDKAVQVVGNGPCPARLGLDNAPNAGRLEALAVGRLGVGIATEFANHSELARDLLFGAARHTIRIAQQDLGFRLGRSDTLYPESSLERLIDFIERGGDVYIVLSNLGALGKSGSTYSNDVPVEALARRLREMVSKRHERLNQRGLVDRSVQTGPDPVNALLCSRVHLAPYRFGPDDKWPGGATFAQHTKFYMVDDRAFYVGSDNMYPVNLQEFGYILDDRRAAQELLESWWNPLWQWSSRAALSGAGVERCIFRELVKPAPR